MIPTINLYLNEKNFNIYVETLKWFNGSFSKNYKLSNNVGGIDLDFFDEDYPSLFQLGYNMGIKTHKYAPITENRVLNNLKRTANFHFTIMCGDDNLIKRVLRKYNDTNQTNFVITKFDYDEVIFAEIKCENCNPTDIFRIGHDFGIASQIGRERKEIDW